MKLVILNVRMNNVEKVLSRIISAHEKKKLQETGL